MAAPTPSPHATRPSELVDHPLASTRSRWETAGWWIWGLMLAIVAVRLVVWADPARNNVYLKVFAPAARDFVAAGELYDLDGGFRYPPLAAALFVPFTWLGPVPGSIAWRLVNVGVLLCGVRALRRLGFPAPLTSREFGVVLVLLALASQTSVNNGQANPLVLGSLLLATAAFLAAKRGCGALSLAAATAFKVYPLAYGLVIGALRPRLLPGMLLGVFAIVLLPFALAPPTWLMGQYASLFELLRAEDRTQDLANAYRDLRLLAAALGVPLSDAVFTLLQAASGLAIAIACRAMQRAGTRRREVLWVAFSLTACWFMLFGPATEKATYMLIGPTTAWGLVLAHRERRRIPLGLWAAANLLIAAEHTGVFASRQLQSEHPLLRCPMPTAATLAVGALLTEGIARRTAAGERLPRTPSHAT